MYITYARRLSGKTIFFIGNDLFDDTSVVHQDSLKLCFMHIVQDDLNSVREEWNSHLIRSSKGSCTPNGHPDELYFLPHILGSYYYCS